jgi:hypothetical protein
MAAYNSRLTASYAEARFLVKRILGRELRNGECVYHIDENPFNNDLSNLVVCPSTAYHELLHVRTKALQECGHVDWRKCFTCKQYDAKENMIEIRPTGRGPRYRHSKCHSDYNGQALLRRWCP